MKKTFLQSGLAIAIILIAITNQAFSQANTTLSNLVSPTSVNQSLFPSSDNTKDFGSSSLSWKNGYFDGTGFFLTGLNVGGSSNINGIQMNPNSTGKTLDLRFMELTANGTNYVGFKAPTSIAANKVWVLPSADGTNGQVLTTNGSGTLSWTTAGSGGGVGTNTTNYIPKWDGSALVTGTLKDTSSSITNGLYSKKGRMTIYRNTGLIVDDGVSAVQGVGTNSNGGTIYSKGFLAAKDINEIVDQEFFPPFDSGLDHAGVMGFITNNASADGAAVLGLNQGTGSTTYGVLGKTQGTGGANYGVYGESDCAGVVNFSAVNYGVYGKAEKATFNYALRGSANSEAGTTGYGIYASSSGSGGNYAGYFAGGKVYIQDWIESVDSIHVKYSMTLGDVDRPGAYEFAVTGGNDAYIDDVLSVHTTTATAQLNVNGTNETILMEGTTPYMRLVDGANKSTFIQASGNDMRIGTLSGNNTGKLIFRFNAVNKNAMDVNGNLGLGTTTPGCLLHLKGNNELLRLDGTDTYIDFLSSGVQKAFIQRTGNDLKIASNSGSIIFGNNVTGDQMWILSDGRIGMGTSTPKTGYKLSVEGKIACRELKVETDTWPDYVFEKEYKLLSLPELENFITENNHLPGVPSATEMQQDGISVGDMQNKLMEKIEELTLYVIDLQKQNDELKQQVSQLAKQ